MHNQSQANTSPNFEINSQERISKEFRKNNIVNFNQACSFVRHLPYGRNQNRNDLNTLFSDRRGTCSTKHGVLKQLADENNFKGVSLIIGIFKMNGKNTPAVGKTLQANKLNYIPEAHCYLKYNNSILDFTNARSKPEDFVSDLSEEVEVSPNEVGDQKIVYHKKYLEGWLAGHPEIKLSLEELWTIREQCIQDLTLK